MNKKIFLLVLCIILITACDNQKNQEKNATKNLCNEIKNDINNYRNNIITKEELSSNLENYNELCSNSITNTCINIKAIMSVSKVREELQKEYLTNLLDNCQNE